MTKAPNTELFCNICNKKITSVCMMSPDWAVKEDFLNSARYHFEHEHGMKPNKDGQQGL